MAAIGIDTLAWAIASTIAGVAARWRLEAPLVHHREGGDGRGSRS